MLHLQWELGHFGTRYPIFAMVEVSIHDIQKVAGKSSFHTDLEISKKGHWCKQT
jgi:hypothetical protein